ncbi:unnamed protein product [Durusdinium trenchii]|uniref:S1 motif domain-containing protein n=1 Tax=Durusdinium trenchii TaxID=1381693 RepID=A0ABP0R9D4_9DINO
MEIWHCLCRGMWRGQHNKLEILDPLLVMFTLEASVVVTYKTWPFVWGLDFSWFGSKTVRQKKQAAGVSCFCSIRTAMAEEYKSRFQAALGELNFGQRCHKLAQLGKEIKAAKPADLQAILDGLVPDYENDAAGVAEAFSEKARLIVAKAAGCTGYAKKLLDAPSKTVGFSAATGGLLTPEDARTAFLSSDTSRKMKKFLLQCDKLESDKEVLEHAFELFGQKDKEMFWPLLARSKSEELLEQYLEEDAPMREWLSANHDDKVPGLPQLARRFPAFMVKLVTNGTLKWRWYWVTEILEQDPMPVLRATLVENHMQGSGPKMGYSPTKRNQDFYSTLAHWGWRRKPEMMLELIEELAAGTTTVSTGQFRSKGRGKGMVLMQKGRGKGSSKTLGREELPGVDQIIRLSQQVMSVHSTRHPLTTNKKIALLMKIWSVLPESHKKEQVASRFADLLPNFSTEDHRKNEITNLIDAFWKILGDVGRSDRQMLLVGPLVATGGPNSEKKPTQCTEFLKLFTRRLPPPLAVEQFFKVLEEFEAATPAYQFIQSDICKSSNGRHDELMKSVFQKYLLKEDEGPVKAAEMFKVLLNDARSRDVIQSSFDILTDHLEGHTELGLLHTVVQRMGDLEKQSRKKGTREITPEETLAVPIEWLQFVELPEEDKGKGVAPHIHFLLMVLHTGLGETNLLGSMLQKFGKAFFWDCFGHVLSAVQGKLLPGAVPAPALHALANLNVKVMQEADLKLKGVTGSTGGSGRRPSKGSFGVGSVIYGVDGTKWGTVVAAEGGVWKLDSGRIAKKHTEGDKWTWAGGATTKGDEGACKYFQSVADMKKKANVKDLSYSDLMALAGKEKDAAKAFDDLLPFLLSRFNAEQEGGRSHILSELFANKKLPDDLWEDWIVDGEPAPEYPTESCLFGLEVSPELDLPELLVKCHHKIETLKDLENATRWVLETAVPLSGEISASPLEDFWKVYKQKSSTSEELAVKERGMVVRGVQRGNWLELIEGQGFMLIVSEKTGLSIMKQDSGNTGERGLWETYPFVSEWWRKLLSQGVKQKAIDFVFVGILTLLTDRQQHYIAGDKKLSKRWWAPLECDEYKEAVKNILENIESGVIPEKEGSAMIKRRVNALKNINIMTDLKWKVLATKRRERVEDRQAIENSTGMSLSQMSFIHLPAIKWVEGEQWDIQKHHTYAPIPWQTGRCRDEIATPELETIAKLLQRSGRRQVLWQIAEIAAMLSGPKMIQLLEASIALLDARFEGMARTVGRHYPYLNSALTKNESQKSSSDVLTPLVELLLLDDSTRDACVAKLMEREDCEFFLLFGASFGRHLSTARQEWLHKCLCKLKAPTETDVEFYHYRKRGPMLSQIARYGKGDPGWRDALKTAKGAVQLYLWHSLTQTEFLKKALWSTEPEELTLIPRLEFADGVSRVSELLSIYPKEQTTKDNSSDVWGWEVIQAAGAFSDINQEVERRFAEMPEPSFCDKVDDPEVETLLSALGRSDNAASAMKVLGPHAGKVKQAKEAVTKMISQLSPPRARVLIRQVMLPKKAGVGLQVAGLKKIVDLRIPDPLELYTYVWRKGECQRDVAGSILSKVATSSEFRPEDVRIYFDYFDRTDNPDDQAHVANTLLDQLIEQPEWVLPYLPKVVSKLAMVPGATMKAVQGLTHCTSNVTDVVEALTRVLQACRLATRTDPKMNKEGTDGRVLADLISQHAFSPFSDIVNSVGRMSVEECTPETLKEFLGEVLRRWHDEQTSDSSSARACLTCALTVWVKLLRPGQHEVWVKEIAAMESRLLSQGNVSNLGQFAQALAGYAPGMGLSPDEWDQMLSVLRTLFVRLFEGPLLVNTKTVEQKLPADDSFTKENKARESVQMDLMVDHWPSLLSHGCSEEESNELFKRCPEKWKVKLAQKLIDSWWARYEEESVRDSKQAAFQQERPDGGWQHSGGKKVSEIVVGSIVSGTVTNSSNTFGVYVNFGCEKDGKLSVPQTDWKKYRVGDKVDRMVVNKVNVDRKFVDLLVVGSKGQTVGLEASKKVAQRALSWISGNSELRSTFMVTLQKMLAKLIVAGTGEEFETSLRLLGPALDAKESVRLVQLVLDQKPASALVRVVLLWLSRSSPEDAVRLWPNLIQTTRDKPQSEDFKTLLKLCEANGLELPKFSQAVSKAMPEEALKSLCASSLPEARLAAIHVLREQHKSGAPPEQLKILCNDQVAVVRAAARDHWVALGGKDEGWQKKKEAQEEEDEDEEGA